MSRAHDMGGVTGFGKVYPEPNEPMFHSRWEGRVLAMVRAMSAAGAFSVDSMRSYREMLPSDTYLGGSYFEIWQLGLEAFLIDKGYFTLEELSSGHALHGPKTLKNGTFRLTDIERVMSRGNFARNRTKPAQFKPGDHVRTRPLRSSTHTRLPRYVWGHEGTIEKTLGCYVFPDSSAIQPDENPQWLYTVVFDSSDLWGTEGDPTARISIDAFEPYLEALS